MIRVRNFTTEQKEFYNEVRNALISGISVENSSKYRLQESECDIYTYVPFSDKKCLRITLCNNSTARETLSALSAINDIAEQVVNGRDIRDTDYSCWYRPNKEMEDNFEIVQRALQSVEVPTINSFSNEDTFDEDKLFFKRFIDKLGDEYHQMNSELIMKPVQNSHSVNIYNVKNNFLQGQDFNDSEQKRSGFESFSELLNKCQKITIMGKMDDVRRMVKDLNKYENDFKAPNYIEQKDKILRFVITDKEKVKDRALTMEELHDFSKKVEKEKQKNIIHGIDKDRLKLVAKRLVKQETLDSDGKPRAVVKPNFKSNDNERTL